MDNEKVVLDPRSPLNLVCVLGQRLEILENKVVLLI